MPAFLRLLLISVVASTAIALVNTASTLLRVPDNTFAWVFPRLLVAWVSGGIFVPVVVLLAQRVRFGRVSLGPAVMVHFVAALAFTAAHYGLLAVLHRALFFSVDPLRTAFRELFLYYLQFDLIAYGLVVGAVHAWTSHAEARRREVTAERLRADLSDERLRTLRAQLQPHFLFNALNAIAMLVRGGQRDAALSTITSLSDLTRRVMRDTGSHEVSLREELAFARQYLAIEQTRIGPRLTVAIDAADDLLDCRVPDLILQPLVENAVRHGAARTSRPCHVQIDVRHEQDTLILSVSDDAGEAADELDSARGIGLRNTAARLATLHGDKARLDLTRNASGGVTAIVMVPASLHHRRPSLHPTPA